ncbi:hypothetical protein SASPL_150973 [Salvia splendens]|uniref:Kelch domain-containing protein 4 n=1 Tax=Salvia splendens TaxID=180675 RepID=A0A8X8Z2Y5_SALSN|nr:hypothetical protein SASPL_150973 [Salvia splendens]
MGKKTKKPGKGKEKTEKKTAKAEVKKARRESKKVSPEDDIDAILLSIQKEEAKKKEVHVEDNVPAPSPRSNCSLTVNPLKETELVLYGGEFYNGNKTFVYGDLYRFDVEKQEWKLISSPNSPPPRSAHQAVAWKNSLYIYGGEFTSPNQERFHHYKDFWVLDLKTNQWEQLNYKGCPSPRSGHRMVLYKHKIIIFGGFYDTLREVRYYNDLHVFDLDQYKWQEIKPRPGSLWPSARSGFQFVVYQDEIYLYGGYSKEVSSSDKKVSEKGNVHSDMWCLDPKTWEWNKVKKTGMPPGPRAGFSMAVHKKRALFFGGVVDMEMEGDVMMSLFLNEIYGFQLDNHRWYPLELRKEKATKHKLKKDSDEMKVAERQNISSLDEDENSDDDADMDVDKFAVQESDLPEIVKPCGRINSCMVVGKDIERQRYLLQPVPYRQLHYVTKSCMKILCLHSVLKRSFILMLGMMKKLVKKIGGNKSVCLRLAKCRSFKNCISLRCIKTLEASRDARRKMYGSASKQEPTKDGTDAGESSTRLLAFPLDMPHCISARMTSSVGLLYCMIKTRRRFDFQTHIDQISKIVGFGDSHTHFMVKNSFLDMYGNADRWGLLSACSHAGKWGEVSRLRKAMRGEGMRGRRPGCSLIENRTKNAKPKSEQFAVIYDEHRASTAQDYSSHFAEDVEDDPRDGII